MAAGKDEMAARLRAAREAAGFADAAAAIRAKSWKQSTYLAHENGQNGFKIEDAFRYGKAYRVSAGWLLTGEGDGPRRVLSIQGYIGAGAIIEPDFEQVPPEGLAEVELPFAIPVDLIGFEVKGESMLPRYDDGDVIACWRDKGTSIDGVLGEELAVRTSDGHRFLKTVIAGAKKGTFDLLSWNAKPILGVRVDWFSDIYFTLRAAQRGRLLRRQSKDSARPSIPRSGR